MAINRESLSQGQETWLAGEERVKFNFLPTNRFPPDHPVVESIVKVYRQYELDTSLELGGIQSEYSDAPNVLFKSFDTDTGILPTDYYTVQRVRCQYVPNLLALKRFGSNIKDELSIFHTSNDVALTITVGDPSIHGNSCLSGVHIYQFDLGKTNELDMVVCPEHQVLRGPTLFDPSYAWIYVTLSDSKWSKQENKFGKLNVVYHLLRYTLA